MKNTLPETSDSEQPKQRVLGDNPADFAKLDWTMRHRPSGGTSDDDALANLRSLEAWCVYARAVLEHDSPDKADIKRVLSKTSRLVHDLATERDVQDAVIDSALGTATSVGHEGPLDKHGFVRPDGKPSCVPCSMVISAADEFSSEIGTRLRQEHLTLHEALEAQREGEQQVAIYLLDCLVRGESPERGQTGKTIVSVRNSRAKEYWRRCDRRAQRFKEQP